MRCRNKQVVIVAALWTVSGAGHATEPSSPGAALAAHVLRLSDRERVHALAQLSRPELTAFYQHISQADFLALGRKALAGFGIYRLRVRKGERIGSHLTGPDVLEVTVRERPKAVLLDFVGGPHKGRRALYDVELRPHHMLARESGILGFTSLWLSLDSWLARRDTHRAITDVGFGGMLDIMAQDLARAQAGGGYQRQDEGFDARGLYCILFTAPPGAPDLSGQRVRFCVDAAVGVPLRLEIYDPRGLREYLECSDLQPNLAPDDLFSPAHAGL